MSRRVAVVFPFRLEAGHLGKDLFLIPEGLRRLGWEVELHCPEAQPGIGWPLPVRESGGGGLERPEQYAGATDAIVFSFLHFPRILAAAREAGLNVLSKGDTTGETVARAHPRASFTHALHDRAPARERAVSLAHWLARIGPLAGRDARELVRVLELAPATVVETAGAREAVRAALRRQGAETLAERIHVVPNPVGDAFTAAAVPAARERLVVAVGRWDLAAKDGRLLARALERFLAARADHRAVVAGAGGDTTFGGRVERAGRLPQAELVALLGSARVIVSSSRWESFSLSSHEGLAMGCTVVGPALMPLRDAVAAGPYGTLARRRDPVALADALAAEASAWERGEREPGAIARFWRERLGVDAIARRYADLLDAKLPLS